MKKVYNLNEAFKQLQLIGDIPAKAPVIVATITESDIEFLKELLIGARGLKKHEAESTINYWLNELEVSP